MTISCELHKIANAVTSDLDYFIKTIEEKQGLNRIISIWGKSDDINTILFYPIIVRFTEIMTHEHGYDLVSRVLDVCNIHQKKLIYQMTYRHALALAHTVNGCVVLKKVITLVDDLFKDEFLDLIAKKIHNVRLDLRRSLIQHVLNLDFTRKTTQHYIRLHQLMAEFDEILLTSTSDQIHELVPKLTSDLDLFVDFIKTKRGCLMVQIILGQFEEIDIMFFEAIKQRFIDIVTGVYSEVIAFQTIHVLKERGNLKPYFKFLRLIGFHALYLTKQGNSNVQLVIDQRNVLYTELIACGLERHYIELSFLKHGSNIVEQLLGQDDPEWALMLIVMEIVKCDEDTLVKLANDEYGNKVFKKTLEVAKERRADLFDDLVDKLKPFVDSLRGTQGENIAAIIVSESDQLETVKDQTVSQGSN